jgi:hypothetical protein
MTAEEAIAELLKDADPSINFNGMELGKEQVDLILRVLKQKGKIAISGARNAPTIEELRAELVATMPQE